MTRPLETLVFVFLVSATAVLPHAAEDHWAFQLVKRPAVPAIDSAWPSGDIDRFVLAKLR